MSFLKIFWRFFEKSDRTKYFFGNGLIEPKNWWKAPYRIVDIPYKTQKRHFSTETVIFGQKKAPAASRQPRKMVLFLEKRYLGQKKSACGKLPTEENGLVPEDRRPDKNSNKNQGKRGGGTHDLAILRSESHENCFVRINFSRRIILKPLKKYLVTKKETLTFYEKSPLFCRKNGKKTPKSSRNGHPWVEIGRRPYQNDQKNKINNTMIELLRQNH